ncbi:hypothetical protein [Pyrodictium abyssi]|uniref:Uncharacterized protein n=1 Tax=Pyrodictium abyssi TaxID=54256 RepID=A0ABN6ZNJ2_9CREN|nr:hypothetical protein PABY_05210 [Pyrodictium abyssi]
MPLGAVERASRLQAILQWEGGFCVSRHASSMLVMHSGRIVATLHVYEDECSLRIYRPWIRENREALEALRALVARLCSRVLEEYVPREQPGG